MQSPVTNSLPLADVLAIHPGAVGDIVLLGHLLARLGGRAAVVGLNKWDLVKQEPALARKEKVQRVEDILAFVRWTERVKLSALTGTGLGATGVVRKRQEGRCRWSATPPLVSSKRARRTDAQALASSFRPRPDANGSIRSFLVASPLISK